MVGEGGSSSPWFVVLAAAVPSSFAGAYTMWSKWTERSDRREREEQTFEQTMQRELETQRANLTREGQDLFDRLKAENDRAWARIKALEVKLDETELDRDNGWNLARLWFKRAHQVRFACSNITQGLATWATSAKILHANLLPPPVSELPSLPDRLEETSP